MPDDGTSLLDSPGVFGFKLVRGREREKIGYGSCAIDFKYQKEMIKFMENSKKRKTVF